MFVLEYIQLYKLFKLLWNCFYCFSYIKIKDNISIRISILMYEIYNSIRYTQIVYNLLLLKFMHTFKIKQSQDFVLIIKRKYSSRFIRYST